MGDVSMDRVEVVDVASSSPTRRGFLAALVGAPVLAAAAVALAQRPAGTAARPPLAPQAPQAPPVGVTATGNLVRNPGFELDRMGATFTAWVLGTPLAESREGIPPTR